MVVCLLFYLGDLDGWFRPGPGRPLGSRPESAQSSAGSGRRPSTDSARPDEIRLAGGPVGQAPIISPDTVPAGAARTGLEARDRGRPTEDAQGSPGGPPHSAAARLDAALGVIDQLEYALQRVDLAGLARLQDGLRKQPLAVPARLSARWQDLVERVETALDCGPKLRQLLRGGEVLAARQLLQPLREAATPAWMQASLDRSAKGFGWPALSADYQITVARAQADQGLTRHRKIRCVQDGRIRAGQVWSSDGGRLTVRLSGAAGFTYPNFHRSEVEPVDPTPEEALRQGQLAGSKGDVVGVLLWCCHLCEVGAKAAAQQLRQLLR